MAGVVFRSPCRSRRGMPRNNWPYCWDHTLLCMIDHSRVESRRTGHRGTVGDQAEIWSPIFDPKVVAHDSSWPSLMWCICLCQFVNSSSWTQDAVTRKKTSKQVISRQTARWRSRAKSYKSKSTCVAHFHIHFHYSWGKLSSSSFGSFPVNRHAIFATKPIAIIVPN